MTLIVALWRQCDDFPVTSRAGANNVVGNYCSLILMTRRRGVGGPRGRVGVRSQSQTR